MLHLREIRTISTVLEQQQQLQQQQRRPNKNFFAALGRCCTTTLLVAIVIEERKTETRCVLKSFEDKFLVTCLQEKKGSYLEGSCKGKWFEPKFMHKQSSNLKMPKW